MIRINLVPREILDRELQRQRALQAAVVGAALLIVAVAVSAGHWYRASRLERELAAGNVELERLEKLVAEVEQLEQTAGLVKARLNVIVDLLKGRPLYPYFMADFAGTLPPGVWLLSLGTSFKDGNQLGVNASASSSGSEDISQWLRNLEKSARFSDASLSPVSISETAGSKVAVFSLSMSYRHPDL